VDRRADVARRAEIVAVQMNGVRQAELFANPRELRHDHARREIAVALDGRSELLAILAPLP
jgi:hypothetical protein